MYKELQDEKRNDTCNNGRGASHRSSHKLKFQHVLEELQDETSNNTCNSSRGTSHKSSHKFKFQHVLHDIPEDGEIIAWHDDGGRVLIKDAQRFTDEVLGIYFGGDSRHIVRPRQLQHFQERLAQTGVVTNLAAREVLLRDVMANHQSNKDCMYMHATKRPRDIRSDAAKDDEHNKGGTVEGMKSALLHATTRTRDFRSEAAKDNGHDKSGAVEGVKSALFSLSTGLEKELSTSNILSAREA